MRTSGGRDHLRHLTRRFSWRGHRCRRCRNWRNGHRWAAGSDHRQGGQLGGRRSRSSRCRGCRRWLSSFWLDGSRHRSGRQDRYRVCCGSGRCRRHGGYGGYGRCGGYDSGHGCFQSWHSSYRRWRTSWGGALVPGPARRRVGRQGLIGRKLGTGARHQPQHRHRKPPTRRSVGQATRRTAICRCAGVGNWQ